jgi:hypothetical protein
MFDLEAVRSSKELTSELAFQAAASSTELKRLFVRIGEIAAPEEGWTRIFKVIARVAAAEWIEGDLQVDLYGDEATTTIAFYSVLGIGIRERLFAPTNLNVPIDEFQRAVVLTPDVCAPLRAHQGLNRMTLTTGQRVRNREVPDFELEEQAKGDGERITMPPPAELMIADGNDSLGSIGPEPLVASQPPVQERPTPLVEHDHEAHTKPTSPPPASETP